MMKQDTTFETVLAGGTSALFVTDSHPRQLLERFFARGHRRLVTVAGDGVDEPLLEGVRSIRPQADVDVLVVGAETRSSSTSADDARRLAVGPTAVRAISASDVDHLALHVDDALGARNGSTDAAVYVHGLDGLLSTAGVGSTHDLVAELAGWDRPSGPAVYVSLAAPARSATVAGLAPFFDAVVQISDGQAAPFESLHDWGLDHEQAFDLLKPGRRRALLRALDDAGGALGLDALVRAVGEHLGTDLDRLRLVFYQTDLPKLVDAGVVAVGPGETVVLQPAALRLWPLLSTTVGAD